MKKLLIRLLLLTAIFVFLPISSVHAQSAGTIPTDPEFKVAFIADTGAGSGFASVLDLIKQENAQMTLHQGDFDYAGGPDVWMNLINTKLGTTYPYFGSDGNHDNWTTDGYGAFFTDRLQKTGIGGSATNENYSIVFKGLKVVFSQEGGNPAYIQQQLASDNHIWKVCSWHKNQNAMQVGGKGDEQGWGDYETCRQMGAVIATGHEHTYHRSKTLTSTQNQTVDTTQHPLAGGIPGNINSVLVSPGKSFVFVSGLGGNGKTRTQQRCAPYTYPYDGGAGCNYIWASIFTGSQTAQTIPPGPAEYGALFITFNYQGNPNRAHAYFKTITGQIVDEFDITASGTALPTSTPGGATPTPTVTSAPGTPTPTTTPGPACNKSNPAQFVCYGDWYSSYHAGGNQTNGDFDGDGKTSLTDFELWRRLFIDANTPSPTSPPATPSPPTTPSILPSPPATTTPGGPTPTTPPNQTRILYTPSAEDFPNPERGFMRQANIFVDRPLDVNQITALLPSDSVVWIYFHLENYRDPRDGKGVTLTNYQGKALEPLGSGKGLDTVNAAFTEARKKGLKLVIRFLYVGYGGIGSTQDPNQKEPDAPLQLVQQHITQLTPLLQQNKDAIAAVQTGFVGYWGEWHSSKYLDSLQNRKAVTDALLAAVPKDRMVMLRYPRYKQLWYGGPLTDAQAFNQSDLARVGIYDDAFLKDDTDDGTFKSTTGTIGKITTYCDGYPAGEVQCWRDYMNKDGRFVPVGGEAGTHSNPPSALANCPNALTQLNNVHLSFLHNGYARVVLDTWVTQGCMPEVRRRLGYRLALKEALIPLSIARGQTMNMQVVLRNEGFASMFNPRPVLAVLKSNTNRYDIPLPAVDPRRWEAGKDHVIAVSVPVPSTVVPGTYSLGLSLPDASVSLKPIPAYAVRFANTGVWDTATGTNILTSNVVVN